MTNRDDRWPLAENMTDKELLEHITRSAQISGPANTRAYIIDDIAMAEAKHRTRKERDAHDYALKAPPKPEPIVLLESCANLNHKYFQQTHDLR